MATQKLIYLHKNYKSQQYTDILAEDCYITYFETDTVIVAGENMPKYVEYNNRTYQNLPSGYQQFQILDNSHENCVIDLTQAKCHVNFSNHLFIDKIDDIEADLNIKDIITAQNDSTQYIIKPNDSVCIIFSSIDLNIHSQTISYEGILLKK